MELFQLFPAPPGMLKVNFIKVRQFHCIVIQNERRLCKHEMNITNVLVTVSVHGGPNPATWHPENPPQQIPAELEAVIKQEGPSSLPSSTHFPLQQIIYVYESRAAEHLWNCLTQTGMSRRNANNTIFIKMQTGSTHTSTY